MKDRPLAAVGMQLFYKESADKEISLDDGLYMLSQYKLGRTSYTSRLSYLLITNSCNTKMLLCHVLHHYLMYQVSV